MNNRLFITIEGGEGAGKTTIIERLKADLEKKGHSVLQTREPGGVEIAEKIRAVILDRSHRQMDERTEALLYAAARRQHLVEKVMPALEVGKLVLCDRFLDSSLAYQGYARGLGMEEILSLNQFAIGGCMPSLTLYFDIPPEVGLARIRANGDREVNRLDLEKLDFHQRVREGYLQLLERFPERMVLIDAGRPVEEVFQEAIGWIEERLFT